MKARIVLTGRLARIAWAISRTLTRIAATTQPAAARAELARQSLKGASK
jgi:hypothetical protein